MLTLTRGNVVDSILIPDARKNHGYPGEPKETARTHEMGMFVVKADGTSAKVTAFEAAVDVFIDDGTNADCGVDGSFDQMVALHDVLSASGLAKLGGLDATSLRVASAVTFKGGVMATNTACLGSYEIPGSAKTRALNIISEWNTTEQQARITLTSRFSNLPIDPPIILGPGDAAYLFNFDKAVTTAQEFHARGACVESDMADADFKWIYWMLKEPSVHWNGWLGGKKLPCPAHRCTEPGTDAQPASPKLPKPSPSDGDCIGGYLDLNK